MTDESLAGSDRDRQRAENFWTVSTTAMTQAEAEQAAVLIETQFAEVHADSVDPRSFMTLHLDRWTAEALRDAVARLIDLGANNLESLLEDFEEFLAHARPYDEDEAHWPGTP